MISNFGTEVQKEMFFTGSLQDENRPSTASRDMTMSCVGEHHAARAVLMLILALVIR